MTYEGRSGGPVSSVGSSPTRSTIYVSGPVEKLATYVPVSQEMLDDFISWLPIWLTHELNCELTMRMFGETWYRGRGELDLIEQGRVPRYDSTIWEDE